MEVERAFSPEEYVTPRFTLRSYQPDDGPLVHEAVNKSYDHLKRFMSWAQPHTPPDEAERLVRDWRASYLQEEDYGIGIFAPDGSRLLGGTGFHPQPVSRAGSGRDRDVDPR